MVTLVLAPEALAIIVRSSLELLRPMRGVRRSYGETIGVLYGSRADCPNGIVLTARYAQPYQAVTLRNAGEVDPHEHAAETMGWVMSGEERIGDYHSHISKTGKKGVEPATTEPSGPDVKCLKESPFNNGKHGLVSLIIAFNPASEMMHAVTVDEEISGIISPNGTNPTIPPLYHVTLRAFYWEIEGGSERIKNAKIQPLGDAVKRVFYNPRLLTASSGFPQQAF